MPYTLFDQFFPDIAENETRSFFLPNNPNLPADHYGLLELYCDEPGCDCRRVIFNVISERQKNIVAVIAFGWEDKKFYKQWFGKDDPEMIHELQGPILNLASPQSKIAPKLLEIVTDILKDKDYVKRLKRHYKIFRDYIENKEKALQQTILINKNNEIPKQKIGRNELCHCGSGLKYKKCCGKNL